MLAIEIWSSIAEVEFQKMQSKQQHFNIIATYSNNIISII